MKRSNIDAMICRQEKITDITRETINKIQLDKLNAVLKREKERQGFYRDLPERLESLDDLKTLPFTTESDLAQKGGRMLLCSQGEIQRIISEQTSGTTGAGKRVFYTEGDCEHTIELFMAGLGEFIYPGSRTMVAMPFSGPFVLIYNINASYSIFFSVSYLSSFATRCLLYLCTITNSMSYPAARTEVTIKAGYAPKRIPPMIGRKLSRAIVSCTSSA